MNPTHWYLELARNAFQGVHHDKPLDQVLAGPEASTLQGTIMALISMTIIYSYLAVESFANYQIHSIWNSLGKDSDKAKMFERLCGKVETFEQLKNAKKLRNLGDKLNIICRLQGFQKPADANPALWRDFKNLAEVSRHFLIHPFPEKSFFQQHMRRIAMDVQGGLYVRTALELIKHLYNEADLRVPAHVERNTMCRFRCVKLLSEQPSAV